MAIQVGIGFAGGAPPPPALFVSLPLASVTLTPLSMNTGAVFPNEPVGFTRIVDKHCDSTNMGTDDRLNVVNWSHSAGTPTLVTSETLEPSTPPTAYKSEWLSGSSHGWRFIQTAQSGLPANLREYYVGMTFKADTGWNNNLNILKTIWMIKSGGGKYDIIKYDGTTAPVFQLTQEGLQGTWNSSGSSAGAVGQWHTVELWTQLPSTSGGNGRFRMWHDGTLFLDQTRVSDHTAVAELQVQLYTGGSGTHSATISAMLGHLIFSVP